MSSDYTRVVVEAYPDGYLSISALRGDNTGDGYTLAGPELADDDTEPRAVLHAVTAEDVTEIRSYLRIADTIHDPGWAREVHSVTDLLDRWKAHTQDAPNHSRDDESGVRVQLREACLALAAMLLARDTAGGR